MRREEGCRANARFQCKSDLLSSSPANQEQQREQEREPFIHDQDVTKSVKTVLYNKW